MNKFYPKLFNRKTLTAPNLLTGFRFLASPVLIWLAWNGLSLAFMILLAVAFLTDILDGFVARLTHQASHFGAQLDSWADVINYLTIALSCWLLWPETVREEIVYVVLIIASCIVPAAFGLYKFGHFTSYHTWMVKIAAGMMGLTLYVMFMGGPVWPFRIAAILASLAALEEIIITLLLRKPTQNIHSIWHVLNKDLQ